MKKKIIISLCCLLCSNHIFGDQVKKMTDKEFVVRKQRHDSFPNVQKPKFSNNNKEEQFTPQEFSVRDIDLELKTLPINFDLRNKNEIKKTIKHNLLRAGIGVGHDRFCTIFDALLKSRIKDFSSHLVLNGKSLYSCNDFYIQFLGEYDIKNLCKPYFVLEDNFYKTDSEFNGKNDFIFRLGCPLNVEQIICEPSFDCRFSNLFTAHTLLEADKGKENEINFNCQTGYSSNEQIGIFLDFFIKNLHYDKKMSILDFSNVEFKHLDNDNSVTFFNIQPKILLKNLFKNLETEVNVGFLFCSNERFIDKKSRILGGVKLDYEINDFLNVYFDINKNVKINTLKSIYNKNHWVKKQAVMPTEDLNLSLGTNVNLSKLKINANIDYDIFGNLPNFYLKDPKILDENFTTKDKLCRLQYDLNYIDLSRLKENVSACVDIDNFRVLLGGKLYQYFGEHYQKTLYRPSFKLKTDVSISFFEKFLFNVNLRALGGIKSCKKNNNEDKILPPGVNIGCEIDYIFSDLYTFFLRCDNLLLNDLLKYDVPSSFPSTEASFTDFWKVIFGITITPDQWMVKYLDNDSVNE